VSRWTDGRVFGMPLPAWLVALSVIPLLGGVARLLQLTSGDAPAPSDLASTWRPRQ